MLGSFDLTLFFVTIVIFGLFMMALIGGAVYFLNRFKGKGREESSIDSVLLQVAVPKGNEVKIDAMDQFFSALYSVKKGGWKQKYKTSRRYHLKLLLKKRTLDFLFGLRKIFRI